MTSNASKSNLNLYSVSLIPDLAQQQYFKDDAFIRYLEYLQYWKKPEYARFVVYPHALYFLDLLQHPKFREHISTSENTQEIHRMQYYHWMYLRNPPKSTNDNQQQQQQQQPSTSSSPPQPPTSNQPPPQPQGQTPSSSQPLLSQ
ncbi:predicted protein [Lichtheimia corymbifera JMRC:FSU:9682]|uniref:Mediator of RNA polymerase II transcription subunit 31 n=1 Tax=Lichtheimia corymbifera JMRC:FSU:9682 TaxID=1263082 RepID=A0A068RXX7_9FUNG|nr:predicted protein [Lichtheimia corymbifera JMRC:FSU:9682]